MWKSILAATAATVITATSLVYAQQQHAGRPHWHPTAEDISAFTDARIAGLKAGLKLTAAQEKNWPGFEQAYRDFAKLRADRMKERLERRAAREAAAGQQPADNVDPIERLEKRANAMAATSAALKHLADAAGPLYQSLDDGQKHRFVALARIEHHHHFGHRGEEGHHENAQAR
jgi:hypothetical protein